jgi:AcrR family transcriptional regulator
MAGQETVTTARQPRQRQPGGRPRPAAPGRPETQPRTKPAGVRRAELFLAQGLEATTVEQITQAAGVAKGSFYLQFATKEELLAALRRDFLEGYREELDAVLAEVPADQPAARLAVWTAVTLSVLLDQAALRALLFDGPRAYVDPDGGANAAVLRLAGLLEEGARAGGWALADPGGTAIFLFHGLLGLLETASGSGGPSRAAVEETAMALVERLVMASD